MCEFLEKEYPWCVSVIHNGYGYFHLYDTEKWAISEFNWRVGRSDEGEKIAVCLSQTKHLHFTNSDEFDRIITRNSSTSTKTEEDS